MQQGSDGKESAWNLGDLGSISGSGRSPREGNDNQLQYSVPENPMDGRTWSTVHGVAKESDTTEWLTLSLMKLKAHCLGDNKSPLWNRSCTCS